MLLTIFIVSLLTISVASASENNVNDVMGVESNDTSDVVSVEKTLNEVNDNNLDIESNADDILSSEENSKLEAIDGTYPQLQNKIDMAEAGSVVTLTQNYVFGNDYDYYSGVLINKPITIDGNGVTIDAKSAEGIFRITADNVIIKNLKFVSSSSAYTTSMYAYDTGYEQLIDIDWKGSNGELINVTYVKSGTSSSPSNILVKMEGNNNSISDLKINSMIFSRGTILYGKEDGIANTYGIIYLKGNDNVIKNLDISNNELSSNFYSEESETITRYGGIICIEGNRNSLLNNSINNNCFIGTAGSRSNTGWNDYSSNIYGGIIYWNGNAGKIINSTFNNNKITSKAEGSSSVDYASAYGIIKGGVIFWNGNGDIENSTYDSNYVEVITVNCDKRNNHLTPATQSAQCIGSTLYITSPNGFNSITNCNISNNYGISKITVVRSSATSEKTGICSGNAAYLNISSGKIYNSIFNKNKDPNGKYHASNLIFEGNIDISHCIFSNHNSNDYIIECYGLETNINYNIFVNGSSRFYSSSKKPNIDYNWWGSNSNPQIAITGAVCNYWLCANLFVDETLVDEPIIYTKLNLLSDDTLLSDEDYNKLPVRDVAYSLSGYGELSSINSNTANGISYLNNNPGQYEVIITSKVDNQVTELNKILNIYKLVDVNINLNHDSIKYQENVIATINMASSDVSGSISIYVDGSKLKEVILDGNDIVIELNDLEIGEHNITAIYSGEGYYAPTSTTKKIIVNKWDAEITTKNYTITYPENLIVEIFVSDESATGNITLTVDKQTYTENITNSKAIFELPIMNAGNYVFVAHYNGDQYYHSSNVTGLVTINKINDFEMKYTLPTEITYGDSVNLDITFDKNVSGEVSFKINDLNYNGSVIDGKSTFNLDNLNAGIYSIVPIYSGDVNYESKNITIKFIIDKANSTVDVTVKTNIIYGNNATIIITTNANGKVRIKVADYDETVSIIDKKAIIEIPNLNVNEEGYSVEAIFFDDNNNYKTSNGNTVLKVFKATPVFDLNIPDINYKESTTINGTFASDINGHANITLSNEQGLTFKITNILIDNGAFYQELNNLNASKYTLTFEYGGNDNFNSTKLIKTFNVFKIDPLLDIDVINATYGQTAKIIINSNVAGNVTINVGSVKTYDEISISDMLIQDVTEIYAGIYSIKVTYNGDENYNAKTFNAELKINKASANVVATVDDITYSEMTIINIKSTVEGSIVVKIDDNYIKNINIVSNTITPVSFEDNIPIGKHNVTILLKSSNNYNESTYNTDFTVSKKQTSVSLGVKDSVYGEDVIVNVTASEDGKVILTIGDITKEKTVFANVLTKINFGVLAANSYDVTAEFDAGNNYKPSTDYEELVVLPAEVKITDIQTLDNIYGQNTTINVKTNIDGTLTIQTELGQKTVNILSDKLTSIDLGILNVGLQNIKITLDAGNNYTKPTRNVTVTINPKPTNTFVNVADSIYGENIIVNVSASENGRITIQIGDIVKHIDVQANQIASINMGIVDAGSHKVNTTFDAGNNYVKSQNNTDITISPKQSNVELSVKEYVSDKSVIINITSNSDGKVTIKCASIVKTIDIIANKPTSIDLGILNSGTYEITANFTAGNNYINSTDSKNFKVFAKINEKDISIPQLPSSASGSVTVKLPSDASGTITLSINGKDYKFDVVNGVANVKMPELVNGAYTYSITYSGDGKYSSFTKTSKVTVNKPAPATKTTLTLKKVKVKRSAKKLTIQATLKINGKGVKNKVIKFKFNKKTYKARTNSKGVAKITVKKSVLKKLKKGKKVTYTASYGKIAKKVTVKVK